MVKILYARRDREVWDSRLEKGLSELGSCQLSTAGGGEGCEMGLPTSSDLLHLGRADACGPLGECGAGEGS